MSLAHGRLLRVCLVVLTYAAAIGLAAGIWNLARVLRWSWQSEQLGESGTRGTALISSKDIAKPSRRGRNHHIVRYRVTSPALDDERSTEVERGEWDLLQPGEPTSYLYDSSDPRGGMLEAERSYRENWLWHRLGLLPAIALCGGYLAWRLSRRIRGRKAAADAARAGE